jgi:uncharacterized membrane protein
MEQQLNPALRFGAVASLVCLIVLCLLWELWLAPLRPGGSLLALKAMPLLLPLRGLARGNLHTFQWASMLILLYFMEGVVRAYSDPAALSAELASVEIVLSLVFYLCAILYVHPAKRAAKDRARALKNGLEKG